MSLKTWGNSKTQTYLKSSRKYYWDPAQLNAIFQALPLRTVSSALDVGTGQGFFAQYLSSILPKDTRIEAVDIDESLLVAARTNAINSENKINFTLGDAHNLPFESGQFDLITEQLMLLHLPDPQRPINEIYRCLKGNGFAFFVEPNNTAVTLVDDTAKRQLSRQEMAKLTNLELAYNRGKRLAGKGDSNIGDLLPIYLNDAGFKNINIEMVNRVNSIRPPYNEERMEIFETLYGKHSYNQWLKLYRDYCKADRMSSLEFEECWRVMQRLQSIRQQQMADQKYFGLDTKVDYIYTVKKI